MSERIDIDEDEQPPVPGDDAPPEAELFKVTAPDAAQADEGNAEAALKTEDDDG